MKKNEQNDYEPSKLTKRLITVALALAVVYGGWYGGRYVTVALVNQGLVVRGLSQQIQACEADLVKKTKKAKAPKPIEKGADMIEEEKK